MKKTFSLLFLFLFTHHISIWAQSAGDIDSSFNGNGSVVEKIDDKLTSFQNILIQPDDKIIAIGYVKYDNLAKERLCIARYNADGTPDFSFANQGYHVMDSWPTRVSDAIFTHEGKLLTIGTSLSQGAINMTRFMPDGSLDLDFGVNGTLNFQGGNLFNPNSYKIIEQPDHKLLVMGEYLDWQIDNWRPFVARFLPNGTLDSGYGTNGVCKVVIENNAQNSDVWDAVLQPDGKVIVCGNFNNNATTTYDWMLFRVNANGVMDSTFGVNGFIRKNNGSNFYENCRALRLLPDGKILAAGSGQKSPGYHFTILRFNTDGTQDNTFGLGGKAQVTVGCCYSDVTNLYIQPDGKILALGMTKAGSDYSEIQFGVARFKSNGLLDQSFGVSGKKTYVLDAPSLVQFPTGFDMQSTGKLIVGGYANISGTYAGAGFLTRLNSGLTVGIDETEASFISQDNLAPNPVSGDQLQFSYMLEASTAIQINLIDVRGRLISCLLPSEVRNAGMNHESLQLPVLLEAGVYFLQITGSEGQKMVKFSKF